MNALLKAVMDRESGVSPEKKKRRAYLFAACFASIVAIGGAVTVISVNSAPSRAERLASRDRRPGGPPDAAIRRTPNQAGLGGWGGGQRRGGGPGRDGGGRPQMMEMMTAQFGLTPEQQTQIKSLQEAQRPQMQAMWTNNTASPDQRRQQMMQMRQQMMAQMREVLTPDQQQKFDQWQSERQQRRAQMRERRDQTRQYLQSTGQKVPIFGGGRQGRQG